MMYFADNELAHRENDKLICRSSPLRAMWAIDDLVSSDGHEVRYRFSCSIGVLASATERKMLQEAFLGGRASLSVQDVVTHFAPAIHAAADKATYMRDVRTILTDETRQATCHSLRQVAEAVAFSCGLEVIAPFDLQVESPSFRRLLLEQAQRTLVEQRVAGQMEHLARATELLSNFEALREKSPELTPGMILRQLSPVDQGATLQMLLLAGAQQEPETLLASGGTSVLTLELDQPDRQPTVRTLPDTLGPLRGIHRFNMDNHRRLALGARDGVWLLDAHHSEGGINWASARAYADPDISTSMGFSRALSWQGQLWACHTEAGLVGWDLSDPGRPVVALRPATLAERMNRPEPVRPRNLLALDESRLLFSDGSDLCMYSADESLVRWSSPTSGAMVEIIRDGEDILTVHADGGLCRRAVVHLDEVKLQRYASGISAAGTLPWLGSMRVLLARAQGSVSCISSDDPLVSEFVSAHQGLRQVVGAGRAVVGVAEDRHRLIIWNSWDGRQPIRELSTSGLMRHRLSDVLIYDGRA